MMETVFYPLAAHGRNYPKPVVPLLPSASWDGWSSRKSVFAESAFLACGTSFIRGRYALAEAMRRSGAGIGKRVLLPAFHCRAIVEPVLYLGAQPCFYPVTADLQPDFAALAALADNGDMPVAAMVMTHYFGFPNDVGCAEQFCVAHRIALIEDCAHALYGRAGGQLLGATGSYAVASIWKFLPSRDGGLLLDNTGAKNAHRPAQSMLAEAKAVAAMLQDGCRRTWRHNSLPVIDVSEIGRQAALVAAHAEVHAAEPGLKEFTPHLFEWAALRSSRWLMKHATHERIARRRQENYLRWQEGMQSVPGAHPLFPDLPEDVVPYAFPLLTDTKGMAFHLLKSAGIPMWRWEDMAVTDCPVANGYRLRLLQLPCHQELRSDELDWMIRTVQSLLTESIT